TRGGARSASARCRPATPRPPALRDPCRVSITTGERMARVSHSRVQNYLVLGLMGAGDLVAGLVLSAIGVMKDNQVLSIVGTVLLISGPGMLAFLVWSRNKPETL